MHVRILWTSNADSNDGRWRAQHHALPATSELRKAINDGPFWSIAAVVCPFNCRPDPRLVRLRIRRKRTLADLTREFSGSEE